VWVTVSERDGVLSLGDRRKCVGAYPLGLPDGREHYQAGDNPGFLAAHSKRMLWVEIHLHLPCGGINGVLLIVIFARRSNRENLTTMSTLGWDQIFV